MTQLLGSMNCYLTYFTFIVVLCMHGERCNQNYSQSHVYIGAKVSHNSSCEISRTSQIICNISAILWKSKDVTGYFCFMKISSNHISLSIIYHYITLIATEGGKNEDRIGSALGGGKSKHPFGEVGINSSRHSCGTFGTRGTLESS